jgi:hypothetical protein
MTCLLLRTLESFATHEREESVARLGGPEIGVARKQQQPTYIQLHRFTYVWQSIFCVLRRLSRIPHVLAFPVCAIKVSDSISELRLENFVTGILRFCKFFQRRNTDFRMFALKRLSETAGMHLS